MDVHRLRCVPVPTAEINALAFSHQSAISEHTPPQLRLALGRSNGDIEIWNPLNRVGAATAEGSSLKDGSCSWLQESILRGGKERTIEGLAWTQDLDGETANGKKTPGKLRLFSIGHSTHVTEWDLATGRAARHAGVGQAEVWCMAVQPRWTVERKITNAGTKGLVDTRQEQLLALGCADGSIVLMSTADGELTYLKTLPRSSGKKARVISLAWHGRYKIVAGYSDSMIRVYHTAERGKLLANMSLGSAGKGRSSETLVWTVKILRGDIIVSGDSAGEIKFWDAKNYTLMQRLKSHQADVLALTSNWDGTTLLSGGMDRRTTLYQQAAPEKEGGYGRWSAISHQRMHQNDVKAMATFESKQMSVAVSGGVDTLPVVCPLRTFGQEYHRSLPPFRSSPSVCSAPKARLILGWWDREASIWKIDRRSQAADEDDTTEGEHGTGRALVARIAVQGEDSITSADINSTGDLVAIASMSALKLFHIRPRKSAPTLRISKVDLPTSVSSVGAKLLRFSPDGKWISASLQDNSTRMYRLAPTDDAKQPWKVLETFAEFESGPARSSAKATWGSHGDYGQVVTRFAWSGDSRILVAGEISGTLNTWVLQGSEDLDWTAAPATNGTPNGRLRKDDNSSDDESDEEYQPEVILGQHWKAHTERLPKLPSAPVVLSFRPDVKADDEEDANIGLHATRHNPTPHSHQLPHGEDRLIAVTPRQELLECHALTGKLTDWSKRNPAATFPLHFRNILDPAKDCVWDTNDGKARVWLYGNSWLWMFDLSHDIPGAASAKSKKRKRAVLNEGEVRKQIKGNAGAGSTVAERDIGSAVGLSMRSYVGANANSKQAIEVVFQGNGVKATSDNDTEDDSEVFEGFDDLHDDADTDDEENQKLVALRRASKSEETGQNHDRGDALMVADGPPPFWSTFKYRPIVGIVALQAQERAETGDASLEVALVERPLWDADVKPRWEGPQDKWRK